MKNVSELFGQGGWSKGVFFVGRVTGQCLELKTLQVKQRLKRYIMSSVGSGSSTVEFLIALSVQSRAS